MRRLRASIRQLFLTLMFTALSVGAVIGMTFWIKPTVTNRRGQYVLPDFAEPAVLTQVLIAALIVCLCGCIARTIYAHRHFAVVLGLFAALVPIFLTIDASVGSLLVLIRDAVGADANITRPNSSELTRRFMAVLPGMVLFAAGMGVGTVFNSLIKKSSGKRITRIRRRRRQRQSRQD